MSASPPGIAALADSTVEALEAAAEAIEGQGAVGTFDILAALIAGDSSGAWEQVQLHASWIASNERNRFQDLGLGPHGNWGGIALTHDAAESLRVASKLAESYDLLPIPAGALALGMAWQADSGAARALLEEAELGHSELLDLLQDELLGARLEGLETWGPGLSAAPASASIPRPDETTSTASVRPLPLPPDLSALPAEDPVLRRLLEDTEPLGRRSRSGPWLFAKGDRLLELHELSNLGELERKRAATEASLQLAFGEIPGAVPALSVNEEGDWLIVETPRFGEDLGRHIAAGGLIGNRLSAGFYGKLLAEAANTLNAMHERGFVHRNIRPETLIFDPSRDQLKVAGFAIASILDDTELDRHRAPESFSGEIGPAMDQYALGIVARELLTIPGSPALTEPIHRVLQRATAPRPGDRFPTIADFGTSLVKAIEAEAPRSLAERVASLSLAKRTALAPAAIAALCAFSIITVQAPGSSETPELILITTGLAIALLAAVVFCFVAVAAALRGQRRFLSLRLASHPLVPFSTFLVLVATGLGSPGEDTYGRVLRSLLIAYCGCALLAPARPGTGSWLIYVLAAWERRRIWPAWVRRLAMAMVAVSAFAILTGPTIAKVLWDDFEFPSESASRLGPLEPVWKLRAALGSDETAYACDKVMSAAATKDRGTCREVAHVAGAIQRNDPASRDKNVFGAPGTLDSYLVQELPAPPNHRFWLLWTPGHKVAGWLYTRGPNAAELIVMISRRAPASDPQKILSTWLYEVVWNGHEWRIAEYRACQVGAPGTGKRPADCVIRSDLTRPDLRKLLRDARSARQE